MIDFSKNAYPDKTAPILSWEWRWNEFLLRVIVVLSIVL